MAITNHHHPLLLVLGYTQTIYIYIYYYLYFLYIWHALDPFILQDLPVDDLDLEGDLEDDWGVLDDEEATASAKLRLAEDLSTSEIPRMCT